MLFYKLGRFLQFVGMILLPIGIAGEVAEKVDLKTSLSISGAGVLVFILGYTIQQLGRPK